MKKLSESFYQRNDVLQIARDLLGKLLVTKWGRIITSGRIVECEAYAGERDKASHASGGRRTNRNEVMYGNGGNAYIYLCYGIHHLFNVVTNTEDIPHAILIRAIEPVEGLNVMMKRMDLKKTDQGITRGPGKLSRAMGIYTRYNGISLSGNSLFIADDGFELKKKEIVASPRIGVAYAEKDALLPYRYFINGNPFVSGNRKRHKSQMGKRKF